jgi:hypothetical protein
MYRVWIAGILAEDAPQLAGRSREEWDWITRYWEKRD